MRRDNVRGLTTAAIVWLTAAIGMACGARMPILALAATAGHFVVVFAFPYIAGRLPRSRWTPSLLVVSYEDGREILRDVLVACTQQDFAVSRLRVQRVPPVPGRPDHLSLADPVGPASMEEGASDLAMNTVRGVPGRIVTVNLEVQGTGSISRLAAKLADIDGVVSVNAGDGNFLSDAS